MEGKQRLALIAVAVAIAAIAFVVLRPDDEGGSTATRPQSAQPPATAQPQETPEAKPGRPAYQRVTVRDGKPVGGVKELRFEKGETVRIEFRSNAAGEIHIHGYDRYVQLKPGRAVRTRFEARLEGLFEVEDHGTATQVAELRVEP